MPIKRVAGGYRWGDHGKVYNRRKDAERQAVAAYANGYKESPQEHAVKNLLFKYGGKK